MYYKKNIYFNIYNINDTDNYNYTTTKKCFLFSNDIQYIHFFTSCNIIFFFFVTKRLYEL